MKPSRLRATLSPLLILAFAPASGQTVTPPTPPAAAGAKPGDVVELSPFEVSATSDEGYAARETLAGTRFKTELKDVPSQISIMTEEFLQDIATVNVEDAFRYSINVENRDELQTYGAGDFNGGVVDVGSTNRVRGLGQPGRTHDFHQTFIPGNTYNTERITFSSGPNSILFGNGNPAGTVDTSFKRANVQRHRHSITLRGDSHDSLQTSVDLNWPVVKDRLAVRVAAMKGNEKNWRAPAGEDAERLFGSVTIKPFKTTTIRGWYEDVFLDRIAARNTLVGDNVTPWIAAGRPVFDNGLTAPRPNPAANDPVFARSTLQANVLLFGASVGSPPTTRWGSTGTSTAASQVYTAITKGPGDAPYQTGTDSYNYSLRDPSISPFDVSVNGTGTRNRINGEIKGFTLEQRVGSHFVAEFSHNEEKMINPNLDMLRGGMMTIQADANRFLPDRVTPNPNVGRYYVEGIGRARNIRREMRENRAMASYELDLTPRHKWLGNHRFAAMYQRVHEITGGQDFQSRHVPAGTSNAAALELYGAGAQVAGPTSYNTLRYRAYLSDPTNSATGRTYYFDLPYVAFDPHVFADGSTVYTTNNPFGGTNAGNLNHSLLDGRVFAMQNRFWRDRLVTTFGWRSDKVRSVGVAMARRSGPTSAFQSILDATLPDNAWEHTSGHTTTMGAVFHVMPWLSVFYNESSTWNVPRLTSHNPDGTTLPGSIGDGHDYGIMLRLPNNRASFRLNKYESTSGPDNSTFRNDILAPIIAIEETLYDAGEARLIPPYQASPGFDPNPPGTFFYEVTSDRVSRGYEAELVANPVRNWRLSLNAAKAEATESNIGRVWLEFVKARLPYWSQHAGVQGPGAATNTVASRVLGIAQTLNLMRQADGQRVEQGREWRANLVTRYSFDEGRLKGFFAGGGYRWRSKSVIGYRAIAVPNEFSFPGVPAEITVPALNAPVFGDATHDIESFVGYTRRLNRGTLRVQLNVRNLFDDDEPVAQRANTSGAVTIVTLPQPRTFVWTATFSF